jgi:hypothetical protein
MGGFPIQWAQQNRFMISEFNSELEQARKANPAKAEE